jgi:hypothetical protein
MHVICIEQEMEMTNKQAAIAYEGQMFFAEMAKKRGDMNAYQVHKNLAEIYRKATIGYHN